MQAETVDPSYIRFTINACLFYIKRERKKKHLKQVETKHQIEEVLMVSINLLKGDCNGHQMSFTSLRYQSSPVLACHFADSKSFRKTNIFLQTCSGFKFQPQHHHSQAVDSNGFCARWYFLAKTSKNKHTLFVEYSRSQTTRARCNPAEIGLNQSQGMEIRQHSCSAFGLSPAEMGKDH